MWEVFLTVTNVLKEGAVPNIDPLRKIPFKLRDRFKKKLTRMKHLGVIKKVMEPTQWASSLVSVEKDNN